MTTMTTLGSILLAALLFAVFGTVRLRSGCGGDCGHCDHSCDLEEIGHGRD